MATPTDSPPHPVTDTSPLAALSTEGSTRDPEFFRTVAHLGIQAAEALEHAHGMGVVHRDIKPSNLMVDNQGHLWITDFGLAMTQTDANLTMTGDLLGTLRYMSPEQVQAKHGVLDHRTDVYSLGLTLYELLTLQPAFGGDDRQKLMRQVTEEDPRPPRQLNNAIPRDLETIVLKATAKEPERRYATAQELADDLRRFQEDKPIQARRPSLVQRAAKWSRRHRAAVRIAVILLLATCAVAGGTVWNAQRRKTELARAVDKELDGVRQSLEAGDLAAAQRRLTAARTRLDAARYDLQRLQTDVARLSKEVSARARAEKQFQEFQQIRERVFSRMYDLHSQEAKQAAKDCRAALDLFNIFGPRDWKRQPVYRNLSRQLQQTLEDDVVELMFVMARLEVLTVTPEAWTILDDEDRRVVVDVAAHQRAIDVLQRIETVSRPTAGVYAFLSQCWREMGRTDEAQKTDAAGKKLQPTTALDYYILGELLAKRRSREGALERYGQALGRDPTHYLSLLATGDTLEKLGQLQAAEMALTGAISANPRPTFPYVKRALIRLRQEKHELATADFAEAARRDPTLAEDYYARGHWNLNSGEPDRAISDWTAAAGLDPKNAAAYFHRGLVYCDHKGEPDKAIADFSRTIQLDPQRAEAYYRRGIAYDKQGAFDRAAADFGEALTRGLRRPEVYTRRGTARALSGSVQLALGDYREAIRLDPNYAQAFFERGIVLCHCLGEFDRAIADFNEAIRIDRKQPLAYYNRAVASAAKGDLEGALAGWTEAIRLDPKFAHAYFERGILYCNGLDEYGKAVADFNQVLRLAPKLLVAYYNRGIACYNRGDLDQALASWTRAIQLGFTRVEVYCSRGILYAKRGELKRAIADFDEAIRLDPEYAPAYNHRAAARAALGQEQEAAEDRAEAVRLLEIQRKSTPNEKAAGEDSLPTTPLTGQASPGRLVCASEEMTSCILRRTGSQLESRTMFFLPLLRKLSRPGAIRSGQAYLRHFPSPLRPRRLRHEPLEERQLLSTVSGTVFEDLDADGVIDVGEPGLEGWTVALEDLGISDPLLTIPNPSGVAEEAFAFSLAPMGNNILAAAEHADRNGVVEAGVAYLLDGSTGEVLQTFENPDPMDRDQFGISLAPLGDDKVVIGTRRDWNTDGFGNRRTGVAYVFDIATGQREITILDPNPDPTSTTSNNFGGSIRSIAAFGDGFLIGSSHDSVVYHFRADGVPLNTFLSPSPTGNDNFGTCVSVMGNDVLAGASNDDTFGEDAGAFYLFDGTSGDLLRTFSHPAPSPGDEFGHVVADGETILTSARYDDTDGRDTGIAFAFNRDGQLLQTFHNPTPDFADSLSRVAINGDTAIIGANRDDAGATDAGAAYLFHVPTGALLHTYLNPTPEVDDLFAVRLAFLANGDVAIGSYHDDVGNVNSGAVYVFEGPPVIPEPSTMTLLLGGGLCLLIHVHQLRRRRR